MSKALLIAIWLATSCESNVYIGVNFFESCGENDADIGKGCEKSSVFGQLLTSSHQSKERESSRKFKHLNFDWYFH